MKEVKGVRQVKPGRWEVAISHRSLPGRRVFRTFEDEEQARAYKVLMLAQLEKGIVPSELLAVGRRSNPMTPLAAPRTVVQAPVAVVRTTAPTTALSEVLRLYSVADNARIAPTDKPMLVFLQKTMRGSIEGVTVIWVDNWVRTMKREERLAPGTIRKRVESLARAIDWWHRSNHSFGGGPENPLRGLPRGYSTYRPGDVAGDLPRDVERDRRLLPGEYERIEGALLGVKRADRERPWADGGDLDMLMLFRLIVATGLRLREAYMLRAENISFPLRTIHVRKSKTGAKREIPMTKAVLELLRAYLGERAGATPVFPFWQGSEEADVLRGISARLSARFATLFEYAGCLDLVQHDLRHEATCRWMEMRDPQGRWLLRPEEVRKITGHKSEAVFMRYLSIRGSDLAERIA